MNKKPMSLPVVVAAFAALTLVAACDKRDNAATPPMPQSTPSTTAPTTPPATGGTGMTPSDPAASTPSTGASR